jgi:hypothetical protein
MKRLKLFALPMVVLATGCASITGSKLQSVSVQTVEDNKEVAGVGCTLSNDAGRWFVTTPGSVTVQKSTADMTVECKKENDAVGHEVAVSKANGPIWGNILAGGLIGYAVDRNTGAGFDYPNTITVIMHKIGEAIGVTTAPAASGSNNARAAAAPVAATAASAAQAPASSAAPMLAAAPAMQAASATDGGGR